MLTKTLRLERRTRWTQYHDFVLQSFINGFITMKGCQNVQQMWCSWGAHCHQNLGLHEDATEHYRSLTHWNIIFSNTFFFWACTWKQQWRGQTQNLPLFAPRNNPCVSSAWLSPVKSSTTKRNFWSPKCFHLPPYLALCPFSDVSTLCISYLVIFWGQLLLQMHATST